LIAIGEVEQDMEVRGKGVDKLIVEREFLYIEKPEIQLRNQLCTAIRD